MRFLIVEPDKHVARALELYLQHQDHEVDCVATADLALAFGDSDVDRYDAMVIERTLADGSGLDVLQKLRREHVKVPMLVIDAGPNLAHLQRAFDLGADDYLGKPFEMRELLARILAHVRRRNDVFDPIIALGELSLDCAMRRILWRGRAMALSPKEFQLVECLALAAGRIVTRDQIMARIYGWRDWPETKTLDVMINHLRKKIRALSGGAEPIRTVIGVGYVIEKQPVARAA